MHAVTKLQNQTTPIHLKDALIHSDLQMGSFIRKFP